MCPACLTTLALVAAGTGTAGGVAAFVARTIRLRPPRIEPKPPEPPEARESETNENRP
jgi:hypothetical protein